MRTFSRVVLFVLAAVGCQPEQVVPVVDEVRPNWGYNAEDTLITIRGDGFYAGVGASDGSVDRYERDFVVSLTGPQGVESLDTVTHLSESQISAVVPAGLLAGWYGVRVVTPGQGEAELLDAFEVTATKADSVAVEASSTSLAVSGLSIVRLKVLNPDGLVVQESFPVTVRVVPTRTSGDAFTLDPGSLLAVELSDDGLQMNGQIGPTGEAFFIVSSSEPDDVTVEADVSIRDRAVISGEELISFRAGAVDRLEIGIPDGLTESVAGESFEVSLQLVDEGGNLVSGQSATVALTEGCGGGGWSEYVTFVDTVTVTVAPNRACEANTLDGFGVVEGGSVTGQSAAFVVSPGPHSRLSALATPEVVQAGLGDVVFFIQGEDSWGNATDEELGELALYDEYGLVSESNGNGIYSCEAVVPGTAQCTARLYRAAASRVVRIETDSGREGAANPVQVIPGPGDRVSVTLLEGDVVAGQSFPVEVAVEDAFGNPVLLGTTDIAGMAFSDEFGPSECAHKGSDAIERKYEFDCAVTVAGDDNELHVQIPTLGVIGHSGLFSVDPGPLATIDLTVDETVLDDGVNAGEPFPLAAEGLDAFGNRVSGSATVTLKNVAGGMDVEELVLVDGVAFQWVVMTRAASGDSIWAVDDPVILGGSSAFDVRPGEVAGLSASMTTPWAFVGREVDVHVALVDDYGNVTEGGVLPYEIDPLGGLGPPVEGLMFGPTSVPVVFEEAGLGENLEVRVGEYSTEIVDVDVALACEDTVRTMEAVGVVDGRVCIAGGVTVSVEWEADDLVHSSLMQNGVAVVRGDISGMDVDLSEPGATRLRGLFIRDDACGEVGELDLHAGTEGLPVGEIVIVSGAEVLVAGSEASLSSTNLMVEAWDCSGDPAALSTVLVRTDRGDVSRGDGTPLLATGGGLQAVLDEAGEAVITVSMADVYGAGPAHVVVGRESGVARGVAGLEVGGDSLPPRVMGVSPLGTMSGWVREIEVDFSEPMLWVEDMLPVGVYFDVSLESGGPVDVESVAWGDGAESLTITLAEDVSMATDTLMVTLYDELRDAAGNRLDGDLDGEAAGDWVSVAGAVSDDAPDVTQCGVSSGWFRPDGDDGEGINSDYVWLFMQATGASDWWQVDVFDAHDRLIARSTKPRSRPLDGSFVFDGRDSSGQVLSDGKVVLEVRAMDENGNVGEGCRAAVQLEQVVSLQ